MKPERLCAGRLPNDIVLSKPGSGPSAQSGTGLAYIFAQNDRCDRQVRLPAIADLAREVLAITPHAPVPFVGIEPRLELAREQRFEARACRLDPVGVERTFNDDEAVSFKRVRDGPL